MKINHLKIYKDSRDPNSEIMRKIEQNICTIDLMSGEEIVLTNHIEDAKYDPALGIGQCVCGIFARDGVE